MVEVVTISSKGQVVIPSDIRETLGIQKNDKFIIAYDKDCILLKRIREEHLKKRVRAILDKMAERFKLSGITEKDVAAAIKRVRSHRA